MKKSIVISIFASLLIFMQPINAGLYTDDLSRCVIESATDEDKLGLVKWMYSAMSLHPAVKHMSKVDENERQQITKKMTDITIRLLTVDCLEQTKKAIKYDGALAIEQSFNVLGQVAGQELFANPSVAQSLSDLDKYFDAEVFEERLGIN